MDEYFRIRFSQENKWKRGTTFIYLFNHKASASFTEIFKGGRENYYGERYLANVTKSELSIIFKSYQV